MPTSFKNRLFVVEGLPCSGKSTTAAFVAELPRPRGNAMDGADLSVYLGSAE